MPRRSLGLRAPGRMVIVVLVVAAASRVNSASAIKRQSVQSCLEDLLMCPDGQVHFRDPLNDCQFPPCADLGGANATSKCELEFFLCPDGELVQRDPVNNCRFAPCLDDEDQDDSGSSDEASAGSAGDDRGSGSGSGSGSGIVIVVSDGDDAGETPETRPCTRDVLVCPDGFFVHRNRSRACQFDACPTARDCLRHGDSVRPPPHCGDVHQHLPPAPA